MTTARDRGGQTIPKTGLRQLIDENILNYQQDTRFRLAIFSSGTDFACESRTSTKYSKLRLPATLPRSYLKPLPSCASDSVPIADLQHNAPLFVYPIRPLLTQHARLGRASTFQPFTLPIIPTLRLTGD